MQVASWPGLAPQVPGFLRVMIMRAKRSACSKAIMCEHPTTPTEKIMHKLYYGPGARSFVPHAALEAIKAASGDEIGRTSCRERV